MTLLMENINKWVSNKFMKAFVKITNILNIDWGYKNQLFKYT